MLEPRALPPPQNLQRAEANLFPGVCGGTGASRSRAASIPAHPSPRGAAWPAASRGF